MRTVTATRYVTPLREGGSLPAIVEADDAGLYVAKFRAAGQGPKALVAEVIAGELARAAGLRVPELVAHRRRPAARPQRAGRRDPRPAQGERRAQPRPRLPARQRHLRPRRRPRAVGGRGVGGRLVRRARRQRRPDAAEPEPAHLAPAALAHRPRRGALLPPRVGRRSRTARPPFRAGEGSRAAPVGDAARRRGGAARPRARRRRHRARGRRRCPTPGSRASRASRRGREPAPPTPPPRAAARRGPRLRRGGGTCPRSARLTTPSSGSSPASSGRSSSTPA